MTLCKDTWTDAGAPPRPLLFFIALPDHSANAITGLSAFALEGNLLPSALPLILLRSKRREREQGGQSGCELEQLRRTQASQDTESKPQAGRQAEGGSARVQLSAGCSLSSAASG